MINGLDIVILLVYIFFIIRGFNNGFFSTLTTIIVIGASIYFAIKMPAYLYKVPYIDSDIDVRILTIFSFFIFLLFGLFLKHKLSNFFDNLKLINFLDKFLGAILGFVKGTLVVFGICYILMFFSNSVFVKNSKIFPYIEKYSSIVIQYVQKNSI